MSRNQSALIVGAGIGGLATAIALHRAGVAVTVLERRTALSEEGAGLQLGPNAVAVLRRLGIADRLLALACAPGQIVMRDGANGALIKKLLLGHWINSRHGAPYWTLHRVDLHDALRQTAAADGIAIETGCGVKDIISLGEGGVRATTSEGREIDRPGFRGWRRWPLVARAPGAVRSRGAAADGTIRRSRHSASRSRTGITRYGVRWRVATARRPRGALPGARRR